MNKPMMMSCIKIFLEKHIVFRTNRLMRVLNVRFFRSLLWIFSLYHLLFSYLLCVLAFFLSLGGQSPSLRFNFTGAQFLPGLGRGFGSWKDRVCLIQMGLRLAPIGTSHSLTRALDHMLQDLLNALDGLEMVWLQSEDRPILLEGIIILRTGEAAGLMSWLAPARKAFICSSLGGADTLSRPSTSTFGLTFAGGASIGAEPSEGCLADSSLDTVGDPVFGGAIGSSA
jgi:hypothetical protein